MSGNVERIPRNVEDLTPEHTLKLQVLVCSRKQGLLRVLVAVDFIEDGVVDQLAEDGLVTTSHTITLQEEGMGLRLLNDVVENYTDLITETLVI